jgi:hypothetical protein
MTTLLQDLRYATRMLGRSPGFTAVAVVMLALGIGANAAIFSLVDAVLIRPLPFPDADRIVTLGETGKGEDARHGSSTSYLNFLDWKAESRSFEAMTIFNGWQPALTGLGEAERLPAAFVTAEVFDVLRVRPELGRAMRPEENRPDAPMVAVVSHGFWQRRMGGDREAAGRTITLNGQSFTVIGVLPAGFLTPRARDRRGGLGEQLSGPARHARARYLRAMGRLKAGASRSGRRAPK